MYFNSYYITWYMILSLFPLFYRYLFINIFMALTLHFSWFFKFNFTFFFSVGREAEHAWNIWGTQRFLSTYTSFSTKSVPGPFKSQPRQFSHLLDQARVSSEIAFYHHSFTRILDPVILANNSNSLERWRPYIPEPFHAGQYNIILNVTILDIL